VLIVTDKGDSRFAAPATLRDVAKAAGVSMTTVSHALSGKRHVAPATVERVRALVPQLGYVPYAAARSLQAGRTFVLGLVVPDISNPFFADVAGGVEQTADENGYGVILTTVGPSSRRRQKAFDLLRNRSIDGLIYNAGATGLDEDVVQMARTYPIVLVDEVFPKLAEVPAVAADHLQGGRLVGEHFRALGHQNVAVITGPGELHSSQDRAAGFMEYFPRPVILEGDYTEQSGRAHAVRIAQSHPNVTAVFATSDTMAFGVFEGLTASGVSVPSDVSVAGFDDVDFAARITPALTTVRQPTLDIGRFAAAKLLDLVNDGQVSDFSTTLPVQLIARASSTSPRTT
jgi:LacI family transcriptional regulator